MLFTRHLFAQGPVAAAPSVPDIPYEAVPNFLKWPANIYMGEGIGVTTNSKGHVFVYTRARDTRLFEFDRTGTYLREIGEGSNSNNSDTMDNGEIYKVELDGNVLGAFGRAGKLAKEFGTVNQIDCRTEHELYVAELANWRVQKVTLHPAR